MNKANYSPFFRSMARFCRGLLPLCAAAGLQAQSVTFSTLTELSGTSGGNAGKYPSSAMIIASDGNLYGTALQGGANDFGTIFKLTPAGTYSVLRTFTGTLTPTPGFFPAPGLCQDGTGNLIGMTSGDVPAGGTNSIGTIFSTPLTGTTFVAHATFNGVSGLVKGAGPRASLIKHDNGWFYGTTEQGGAGNHGVLFKFKPKYIAPWAEYTALVDFTNNGASNKGKWPNATLLDGGNGYLYGTTYTGGTHDFGTLFKFRISDETLTTIVNFTGNSSPNPGKFPVSQLCKASDGLIYGTTGNGGGSNAGVIFRLNPVNDAVTTIIEFTNLAGNFQGAGPFAGLVQGNDGNLYGSTQYGGSGDHGTIFRLTPGGAFTHKLVEFTGTTGNFKGRKPYATMVKAGDGTLYGSTLEGGLNNGSGFGTLYKLVIGTQLAPGAVTGSAGSLTATSVTLNGTVNPRGAISTWQFEYGATTSYGSSIPLVPSVTGSGITAEAVSIPLTGLTSGATYHFRLKATNSGGTNYGDDGVFTTSGTPQTPIVVTGSASGVTNDSATLNGTVNPQGNTASWQFEYGLTQSYGQVIPLTAGTTGSGSTAEAVSITLSGLPQGITIHYRLKASNGTGSAEGSDAVFTTTGTPQAPGVVTGTVTGLTDTTATLNGTVNPRGTQTSWQFEYGSTPAFGSFIPVTAETINGLGSQNVNASLTGLAPGTLLYFRLTATSAASPGTVLGSIGSFTTLLPPEVVTQAAIGITQTGATLLGSVNPRGAPVTWQFEYGATTSYGSLAPLNPGSTSGSNSAELVAFNLTGLNPGTTLHYRLNGTNTSGISYYGSDFSFTTPQPPTPVTGTALNITATGVTLQGTVNPHGLTSSWQFDYGATASYGFSVPVVPGVTGNGISAETVSTVLTGLIPNTTYHFRLRASNGNGSESGTDATFTTSNNIMGWRQFYFGTMADSGDAANQADPDRDGVVNLLEYGYGMNPTVSDPGLRPQPTYNGSVLIASFTQPAGVNDVTYGAEVSTNLTNWSPIADGGSGRAHTFAAPATAGGRNYMRLKVILVP